MGLIIKLRQLFSGDEKLPEISPYSGGLYVVARFNGDVWYGSNAPFFSKWPTFKTLGEAGRFWDHALFINPQTNEPDSLKNLKEMGY